jgi:hypothetical protein
MASSSNRIKRECAVWTVAGWLSVKTGLYLMFHQIAFDPFTDGPALLLALGLAFGSEIVRWLTGVLAGLAALGGIAGFARLFVQFGGPAVFNTREQWAFGFAALAIAFFALSSYRLILSDPLRASPFSGELRDGE